MPAYYQAHASILSRVNNGGEYLNYYYAVSKMNPLSTCTVTVKERVKSHIYMWFYYLLLILIISAIALEYMCIHF